MAIEIKKASKGDVQRLLAWRIKFMLDTYNKEMSGEFVSSTLEYLEKNISTDNLTCYLAEENSNIVSSVVLSIYNAMPKLHNSNGRVGYIFNVYTLEKYRGQGLARKLLLLTIDDAKKFNVKELYLNAEPKAIELYKTLGFEIVDREMVLRF